MITVVVTNAYGQKNSVAKTGVESSHPFFNRYRTVPYNYFPELHNNFPSRIINKNIFWGIEVDLKKMRQKGVVSSLKKIPLIDKFNIVDYEKIPKEISVIQMYDGNKDNLTTIVHGNLKGVSASDFFNEFLKKRFKSDNFSIDSSLIVLGHIIDVHKIKNVAKKYGQKMKKVYSGRLDNLIVFSLDIQEVKYWLSKPNAPLILTNKTNNNDIFLQFQLKGGFALDTREPSKNREAFESNIFRKAKSMYLIISESNEELFIGALISTNNNTVAKKIAKVLDGIIAVNGLTEESPATFLKQKIFERSEILYKDDVVRIGTLLTLEEIENHGKMTQK